MYSDIEKQNKEAHLVVTLEEEFVEMFLQCLSQSTADCAPHGTLWKRIYKGTL